MSKQWLKNKEDLSNPFDLFIYNQMEKWCPEHSFEWYMSEICYLYEILYI